MPSIEVSFTSSSRTACCRNWSTSIVALISLPKSFMGSFCREQWKSVICGTRRESLRLHSPWALFSELADGAVKLLLKLISTWLARRMYSRLLRRAPACIADRLLAVEFSGLVSVELLVMPTCCTFEQSPALGDRALLLMVGFELDAAAFRIFEEARRTFLPSRMINCVPLWPSLSSEDTETDADRPVLWRCAEFDVVVVVSAWPEFVNDEKNLYKFRLLVVLLVELRRLVAASDRPELTTDWLLVAVWPAGSLDGCLELDWASWLSMSGSALECTSVLLPLPLLSVTSMAGPWNVFLGSLAADCFSLLLRSPDCRRRLFDGRLALTWGWQVWLVKDWLDVKEERAPFLAVSFLFEPIISSLETRCGGRFDSGWTLDRQIPLISLASHMDETRPHYRTD